VHLACARTPANEPIKLVDRALSRPALICGCGVYAFVLGLGLFATADLARIDVAAVASAVSKVDVRKFLLRGYVRSVYSVADSVVGKDIEFRNEYSAAHYAGGDVHHIVRKPATVRIARRVSCDQSEASAI
jgi:hypothetical protein